MSIQVIRVTRNVCNIAINRPDKRNALNLQLVKQLQRAINDFEHDDQYSVAILSGVGGNFCAGYDLNDVIDCKTGLANLYNIEQMLWPLGTRLSDRKIIIASIEGHAAGFGYELALKCDFRVGERDSRMGFLNRRFGIPIMNGGTVILPRLIGHARSMDLVATGKAQLAPQALEHGIMNFVADVGCSMGQSLNLARSLAKFRQDCLIRDLNCLRIGYNESGLVLKMLEKERKGALDYLKACGKLETALKFLQGTLCRHGSTNLGNLLAPEAEVTL